MAASACSMLVALPAQAQTEIQWWHAMSGSSVNGSTSWPRASTTARRNSRSFRIQGPLLRDPDGRQSPHSARRLHRTSCRYRGRHRHHDGRQGRHQSGIRGDARRQRKFNPNVYAPAVAGYYTAHGKMLSLPFNSSTPVLTTTGTPSRPPGSTEAADTWPEVALAAAKLKISRPQVFIHHQLAELDTAGKFLGLAQHRKRHQAQRLQHGWTPGSPSNPQLHVRHIENLANMAQHGGFVFKGRLNENDATLGLRRMYPAHRRCTFWQRSSAMPSSTGGIGTLPYPQDVPGAPQDAPLIGHASL